MTRPQSWAQATSSPTTLQRQHKTASDARRAIAARTRTAGERETQPRRYGAITQATYVLRPTESPVYRGGLDYTD